jgi:transposase/DNA-binding XRE family transcriptional regulator
MNRDWGNDQDMVKNSVIEGDVPVVAGVDTHKDVHHAAVITTTGKQLEAAPFPATPAGYRALTAFITAHGPVVKVGVEGTSSYGAGLARHLATAGIDVVEVLRPSRQIRRMRGKTDEIDAYAAAQTALAGIGCSTPKHGVGLVEAMRVTMIARASAVKAGTDARLQIRDLIVSAPDGLRCQYQGMSGPRLIDTLSKTRTHDCDDPLTRLTRATLRALAKRVQSLDAEIADYDRTLRVLATKANPALLQAKGIGVICAAQLLIVAGDNPQRIRNEAAFAMMCGAAPIPASSGKTTRHRLNRGGNRTANSALYHIAIVRLHSDERTRTYATRRRGEGKTTKEIIRCLKRAIAREVFHIITNPPAPIDVAELRPLRENAHLTLAQAADDLKCSIATLSNIERGHSANRTTAAAYHDYLTQHQTAA